MLVSKKNSAKIRRNFANFGDFGGGRNFCKNKIENPNIDQQPNAGVMLGASTITLETGEHDKKAVAVVPDQIST